MPGPAARRIARELQLRGPSALQAAKAEAARELGLPSLPTNAEVLASLGPEERLALDRSLRTKPVRSLSGVAVVAVMCGPAPCPHGTCSYCPRGERAPQSYTGHEPAAMRAIACGFDPYLQASSRLAQLEATGHPTDKVELIVMGGTFPSLPTEGQEGFVRRCLDALNGPAGAASASLEAAQRRNERSRRRCVGLTIETRPDWCREGHVDLMLRLGATRVELGVQTVFDDVYERVGRGHTVADVAAATRTARDAGLKVCYHLMPGLPGSDLGRDLEAFRTVFSDPRFMPDMVKVYPTLVVEGTRLHEEWRRGEYRPPTAEGMVGLLSQVKAEMPRWVRTMRIQRDIPAGRISDGVRAGNLAELVARRMAERGLACRCIRCREVGRRGWGAPADGASIGVDEYEAGGGTELFVEAEARGSLLGYCRLRIPSPEAHRPEVGPDAALLRELRVCGEAVPIGARREGAAQHQGLGRRLLAEAERLAGESGRSRLLVLSGIGARPYFRRSGYRRLGPYMARGIRKT